jgi:transposase
MKYVGIDLHKQTISVCVVNEAREVLARRRFRCAEPESIRAYFAQLGPFRFVVEATASYEWLFQLLEPLAERGVLAHPKKMRVIAESFRKSDKLDAQVLAEFLADGRILASYRPTPRQRDHRRLLRHRVTVQRRIGGIKCRIRNVLADHNADIANLFTRQGLAYLASVSLSKAERFVVDGLVDEFTFQRGRLAAADRAIDDFAKTATEREREARLLLRSIPGVGRITAEVVLSELADPSRFRSQKAVVAYSGLSPGQRESGGKRHELHIEKEGSKQLRWILVEAAWRLRRRSTRWALIYEQLRIKLHSKKKAIVAVARRLLCLMKAILDSGRPYDPCHPATGSGNSRDVAGTAAASSS